MSAEKSAWTSAVAFDSKGYPHIADTYYLSNHDQRYRIASWDGKQWQDREVAYAGSRLYEREASYTGLITLDPSDPSIVAISTNVYPNNGKPLGEHHQIFKARLKKTDDTDSINWQQLTDDKHNDNLRPIIVVGEGHKMLIWLKGKYTTYTNYYLDAVGMQLN